MRCTLTRTILAFAALLPISLAPVSAVSQAISMIYGESIQKPVFVTFTQVSDIETYAFLTCARSSQAKTVEDIGTRRFVRIASYWDMNVWKKYLDNPNLLPELKPEAANQHGRLYLPTPTAGAIVVSAGYRMGSAPPIPSRPEDFVASCTLTSNDLATARRLGIPGF
jgi:hypothetical protein